MESILTRIRQLEEQAREQAATVSLLSSNVAYLSSENESLRSKNEEQDRVIGDLSRSVHPDGFWVWEVLPWGERKSGAEAEGRWVFSSEKYKPRRPAFLELRARGIRARPKPTLFSLPPSVLQNTFALLDSRDLLTACQVSFKVLQLAGRELYLDVAVDPGQMVSLIISRIPMISNPRQLRIRTFLCPVLLSFWPLHPYQLPFGFPSPSGNQVPVETLYCNIKPTEQEIRRWSPLFQLIDPRVVRFGISDQNTLPSISHLDLTSLSFLEHWFYLQEVWFVGAESVVFLRGRQRLAFRDCLERRAISLGLRPSDVYAVVSATFCDGSTAAEVMGDDASLQRRLARPFEFLKPIEHLGVVVGF
ncbi:hypothetical protein BDY24DRAFT_375057 [Mrakia frigida]|uniref:uncharacterized protein n=1 Tax=Mrakia frigida TaxID=29902 RepID=UPI003FCC1D21